MATCLRPDLLLLSTLRPLIPKARTWLALTEEVIAGDKLTTLMVTHWMHQAVSLGDRLIMWHP